MPETHLSQETYDRLTAELHELTTVGRTKIAQAIEAARNLGDLSENGDYHAAKDEQGRMEGRIRQLKAMLDDAVITDAEVPGTPDEVLPGSTVTVRFSDGYEDTFLLGSIEERREGVQIMSPGSPLGAALIGRKKGETVEYEQPNGAPERVDIVDVTR
ncbi:MAG TPA: transcription elongation factor GreA [Acidimicrobiales bacterium]